MQLSQLIAAVRDEVQDTANLRWSDATITRYLNDAQLDLASDSRALQTWQVHVPVGASSVAAPTGLLIPHYFWYVQDGRTERLHLSFGLPGTASQTGFPSDVYLFGNQIGLWPTASSAGQLHISGVARPALMQVATDTPSLLDVSSLLIEFAVWRCLSSDGDPGATPKRLQYQDMRIHWMLLESQKYPMPDRIV